MNTAPAASATEQDFFDNAPILLHRAAVGGRTILIKSCGIIDSKPGVAVAALIPVAKLAMLGQDVIDQLLGT